MNLVKILINMKLDRNEFDTLLKAIDYYSYTSSQFEYGEHVEFCQNLRSQLIENFNMQYKREERIIPIL